MSISCRPDLLIADEPTTALDVTIQAQILQLLRDLQKDLTTSILFITHDLSVLAHIADRIAVMYFGKIVELADRMTLWNKPLHPYTNILLSVVPIPDPAIAGMKKKVLPKGDPPSPINPPTGCSFHT